MLHSSTPLMFEATRGAHVESSYLVDAFACDSRGQELLSIGDAGCLVYPRSAIKLLQALAMVESGAADHFGLGGSELALSLASHRGEMTHAAAAQSILAKIGLRPDHLACGSEWPRHTASYRNMIRAQRIPEPIHHNCSGKHAGGLCWLQYHGETIQQYTDAAHPLQRQIVRDFERFSDEMLHEVTPGIDGCSYPTYPRPLTSWTLAFARIADPSGFGESTRRAVSVLKKAAGTNPFMVAGEETFISLFMRQFGVRLYIKNGAEGFMGVAVADRGIGLCLKVRSGEARIAELAAVALLEHLKVLSPDEAQHWHNAKRFNANGRQVGEIRVLLP